MQNKIEIYQSQNGEIELKGDIQHKTLWAASLNQIAELFGRDKSVISRHIKNIFINQKLEQIAVVAIL